MIILNVKLILLSIFSICAGSNNKEGTGTTPFDNACWIASYPEKDNFDTTYAAPYFRKGFNVTAGIKKATAFITGVGYFEFYLNGKKVGDHILDPVVTRYDKTVKYLEFEVTDYLRDGKNVAGAILGNGFYNINTESAWNFNQSPWRNVPAFICCLYIVYENGTVLKVYTDESWKCSTGPIIFDQLRNGEYYDARKELAGWNLREYNDDSWKQVFIVKGPEGRFSKQIMPAIRKSKILKPQMISEPKKGIFLVDFGQNISGWAEISVNEEKGQEVIMRYGERVYDNGTINQKELSRFIRTGETQTTRYICKGRHNEKYHPRFTYFGFRYVQIEGLSKRPCVKDIKACMIHTAFDTAGYFECSNSILNQLHKNIQWSYLGNFHSFPEDCPHREKMGWTGDAQLVVETGMFNFNAFSAYKKWLNDFKDEQRPSGDLPGIIPTSGWGYSFGRDPKTRPYGYGPHWEGAVITIPWQLYRWSGDTAIISSMYPVMKKYINHLENISQNYLLNFGIDDHKSVFTHTEGAYISSAYFHLITDLLAKMAGVIGKEEDMKELERLSHKIFNSFQDKYYHKNDCTYGNAGQTCLALALNCGLVPEIIKMKVLDNLINKIKNNNYLFDAGVVGVKNIIDVCMKNDKKDILYKMSIQTQYPSFGNWIEKGATTMWQNWDGSQSRNHIMFGSIGDFLYKGLAGINPVDSVPGMKKILLNPYFPNDMNHLTCNHRSAHGWIKTQWNRKGESILYMVEIPENTTADLVLRNIDTVEENNYIKRDDQTVIRLTPGKYRFILSESENGY